MIVLGCARGGTSLVAGLLRELGVMMGERVCGLNHEDVEFLQNNQEIFEDVIRRRNQNYSLWGFKNPHSVEYLPGIWNLLINPHILYVSRDKDQVAERFQKYQAGRTYAEALQDVTLRYQAIESFLESHPVPSLRVRHEEILEQAEQFIDQICTFAGLKPSSQQKQNALLFADAKKGYQYTSLDKETEVDIKLSATTSTLRKADNLVTTYRNLKRKGNCYYAPENNDPQIIFQHKELHIPFKQVVDITIDFECEDEEAQPMLYFDVGYGFSHHTQKEIPLKNGHNHLRLTFPRDCYAIRLDPVRECTPFHLKSVEIFQ